jgi:hypothetical protein
LYKTTTASSKFAVQSNDFLALLNAKYSTTCDRVEMSNDFLALLNAKYSTTCDRVEMRKYTL